MRIFGGGGRLCQQMKKEKKKKNLPTENFGKYFNRLNHISKHNAPTISLHNFLWGAGWIGGLVALIEWPYKAKSQHTALLAALSFFMQVNSQDFTPKNGQSCKLLQGDYICVWMSISQT